MSVVTRTLLAWGKRRCWYRHHPRTGTRASPHSVSCRTRRRTRIAARFHQSRQDRLADLGHRRRCATRPLCARQVPRRDPAVHRPAALGCRAGAHPRRGDRDEEGPRRCRYRRSGRAAARRGEAGVLQHVRFHLQGPAQRGQQDAAPPELRGVPRRLLPERAGDHRELRPSPPASQAHQSRCPGSAHREVLLARPRSFPDGLGQPRHGHRVRRAGAPVQRGQQRGSG